MKFRNKWPTGPQCTNAVRRYAVHINKLLLYVVNRRFEPDVAWWGDGGVGGGCCCVVSLLVRTFTRSNCQCKKFCWHREANLSRHHEPCDTTTLRNDNIRIEMIVEEPCYRVNTTTIQPTCFALPRKKNLRYGFIMYELRGNNSFVF